MDGQHHSGVPDPGPTLLTERRIRRHAYYLMGAILMVGGCLALATWGLIFHVIESERQVAIEHARNEANNFSAAFHAEVTRTLDAISVAMTLAAARLQADAAFDLHAWRRELPLLTSPEMQSAAILGPDGKLRSSTNDSHPKPVDLSDRAYFRVHLDGHHRGVFVSQPLVGRITGQTTIKVSRRIDAADGSLLGVIVFNLAPGHLTRLHNTVDLGARGTISLVGTDHVIRARFGAASPNGDVGVGYSVHLPFVADNRGPRPYSFIQRAVLDQATRLYSVRQLDDYPLYVSVGLDLDDVLQPARLHARQIDLIGMIATALLLGMVALLIVALHRRTVREISLRREQIKLTADIAHGREVEARLRHSEQRLRDFAEMASDWFWEQDAELRFTTSNLAARQLAPDGESLVGKCRWEANDTSQAPEAWESHQRDLLARRAFRDFRFCQRRADGTVHHVSINGIPVYDDAGSFQGYRGTGRDVTAEVEAAVALRIAKERAEHAEALLRDAIDSMAEGFVIFDAEDRLVHCNDTYRTELDSDRACVAPGIRFVEILEKGLADGRYLDAVGREPEWLQWRLQHHYAGTNGIEAPLANGQTLLAIERRMRNGGIAGLRINITALKQAQSALRDSEARLDRAQEIAGIGSWELNVASGRFVWSKEMFRIRGLSPEHFEPTRASIVAYIHADDIAVTQTWMADLLRGVERDAIEYRIVRLDGEARVVRSEARLVLDPDGSVQTIAGTLQDITERRRIEQRLVQAQKMEAIGNLTGGMAHDFNNLLGVIIGNLHLLSESVAGDPDQEELCNDALGAARRGADLTRDLLAFGRRQSLRPQVTDINRLVTETTRLLARMLGEQIVVDLQLSPALQPTVVDAVQLEAALTNLATNARDAMPRGGNLTITTRATRIDAAYAAQHTEAVPGEYVLIEVTDTGVGMASDVTSRVFEPFFTTKDHGKGTGLGLSMVFGFIKQSGGHVSVYSEPGRGTTMRLYLPYRHDHALPARSLSPRRVVGGHETILLAEDNPDMRRIAVKQLNELGYEVIEAACVDDALAVLETSVPIDLLLTDIVMPGPMDGVEMAEVATLRRPTLKVLLMSGFSQARFDKQAASRLTNRLISKPFDGIELAAAVRDVLEPPSVETRCESGTLEGAMNDA